MTTPKIAIQSRLWGVEKVPNEYPRIFGEAIRAGYAGVEARHGLTEKEEELKRFLSDNPLELIALHAGLKMFGPDSKEKIELEPLLERMNRLGSRYLVVSCGRLEDRTKWFEVAARVTEQCRAYGVQFCYHNHSVEFEDDRFFDELTAHGVALAADLAWVWRAGKDVVAFVDRYAASIKYVHVKDATRDDWRELGQGEVDLIAILERVAKLELPWWTVEQDYTDKEPFVSSEISRKFLSEKFHI